MQRVFKVTMRQLVEALASDGDYPLEDDRKNTLDVVSCEPVADDMQVDAVPTTTDDMAKEISSQISYGGRAISVIR